MTEEEFLKHVYHTRQFVIIPVLGRAKLNKHDFLNKRGYLDEKKLESHLKTLYKNRFNK